MALTFPAYHNRNVIFFSLVYVVVNNFFLLYLAFHLFKITLYFLTLVISGKNMSILAMPMSVPVLCALA